MNNQPQQIDIQKIVKHWVDSATSDSLTMEHLYESKDYHWSLFIGHLVIEKLLKALVVQRNAKHPLPIHDLLRLAKLCELQLSEEQTDLLDTISTFNINARYDDYKLNFYRKCTKEYTDKWIQNIKVMQRWIQDQL